MADHTSPTPEPQDSDVSEYEADHTNYESDESGNFQYDKQYASGTNPFRNNLPTHDHFQLGNPTNQCNILEECCRTIKILQTYKDPAGQMSPNG